MTLKRASSPFFFACSSLPLAIACALSGCSSSSKTAPDPVVDLDAGVVEAAAPQSFSFTVSQSESAATPIAGAMAYAQYKDGTGEHAQSDAMGKVTLTSPGLASGVLALSLGIAKRSIQSLVEPDVTALGSKGMALSLLTRPTFKLSGPLTPLTSGDSILMQASASAGNGNFQADKVSAPASYAVRLPPNELFTIYGSEFLITEAQFSRGFDTTITKWFHVDHPGLTSDTTFALDLTALPSDKPATATGTLEIPGGTVGPLGGASTAVVLVLGDDGQSGASQLGLPNIGFTTSIKISSDSTHFDYALEYVPYPNVKPSTYAQITQVDGSFSYVVVPGFPTVGQKVSGLAIPVALGGPLAAGSEIDATVALAGESAVLQVNPTTMGQNGLADQWDVTLPPGKVSKVPMLPAELKALLPAGATFNALVAVGNVQSNHFTRSRTVAFTP